MKAIKTLLTAALMLVASLAVAQTASIVGTVTDTSGAVVSGAEITILNIATGAVRTVTTGDTGGYTATNLPNGKYQIEVKKANFANFRLSGITLTVDQVLTANVSLKLGPVSEEVNVNATDLPPIDTVTSQVSNVVDSRKILELPLMTRDPYSLILLSPGTIQSNSGLGGFSVNGARERNNNFLLDGGDNNDTSVPGIASGLATLNPDATEEFRVITNNFMPEFGRNNGAIIDVVTKSGSNGLHGSAYWFGRYNGFGGARDYFNHNIDFLTGSMEKQNPYVRNQFGFSVGGPIIKNKTFFFVNNEWNRFRTTLTNVVRVPTPEFKTGIFTYVGSEGPQDVNIADPESPNNLNGLPLDPLVQSMLALYPNPTVPDGNGITGLLFFPSKSAFDASNLTTKLDHHFTDNEILTIHADYDSSKDPVAFHDEFLPNLGATSFNGHAYVLGATLTSTIRPTIVNEAKFGWNKTEAPFACGNQNVLNSFGATDPFGRARDFTFPLITGFGCQSLGDSGGQGRRTGTWDWADNLTWVKGAHTLKFGADLRRVYENGFSSFGSRDTVTFTAYQTTALTLPFVDVGQDDVNFQNLASALLGFTDTDTQSQFFDKAGTRTADDFRKFRQHEYGFYVQDSWKIRPNLTLNLGARYQFNGVPFEVGNNFSNLFQDASGPAPDLGDGNTGFTFSLVGPGTGHLLYNNDYSNFEPRVGFAWDPYKDGKTSIRGAFGIFHDRVFGNVFGNARGNPPFQQSPFSFTFDTPENVPLPETVTTSPVILDGTGFFPTLFAKNIKMPASYNWNFGVQHEILRNLTLDINYVGAHAIHQLRVVDGNPPQPNLVAQNIADGTPEGLLTFTNLWFGGPGVQSTNNNAFFQAALNETTASSYYHGLQMSVTKRMSHGFQIQGAYTWSHSIDNASDPLVAASGNRTFPRNSNALFQERGNSDFDIRQRLVINYSWQLPFGKGQQFANSGFIGKVLEGWQFSGIASFQTGHPYDIFYNRDTQHTGLSARGDLIGDPSLPAGHPKDQTGLLASGFCIRPDCPTPWGNPGIARNRFYGPSYNNWNVVMSKDTTITERMKLQFRAEVFNLFNRTQFGQPGNTLQSPTFGFSTFTIGSPDGTSSARQLQVALKVLF